MMLVYSLFIATQFTLIAFRQHPYTQTIWKTAVYSTFAILAFITSRFMINTREFDILLCFLLFALRVIICPIESAQFSPLDSLQHGVVGLFILGLVHGDEPVVKDNVLLLIDSTALTIELDDVKPEEVEMDLMKLESPEIKEELNAELESESLLLDFSQLLY